MPSDQLPKDAYNRLVSIGGRVFDKASIHPGVIAFWWPRFLRIARWFIGFETNRRSFGIRNLSIETEGQVSILSGKNEFVLTARCDRVDLLLDGSLSIIDYKTGMLPSLKQVSSGLIPQLLLEALIVNSGGLDSKKSQSKVSEIAYVRLSGGRYPGEFKPLRLDLDESLKRAFNGLCQLILRFDQEETPYLSRPRPQFNRQFSIYDHLARVKEWSFGDLGDNN